MKKILITGGSGLVGAAVVRSMRGHRTWAPLCAVRRAPVPQLHPCPQVGIGDITADTDWGAALAGVDAVVHAAARVHLMQDGARDPLAEFRRVNVEGSLNLARQAAAAGVRRFIFISSIKVNGEGTPPGRPYTADDEPAPVDPYGISKHEAELGLRVLAARTGMEVVIIRPVLVYGPGVRANFLRMLKWVASGLPLPLGAIHNRRSLVALDNLVDLILRCIDHPAAANRSFLVSDGEDLSTPDLLARIGHALGRPVRLWPVPGRILHLAARLLGKRPLAHRLCSSLQVDITRTRELLGWRPVVTVDEALAATARHFLGERQS